MPTKAGLPGWFPEDFKTDPDLLAAFEDSAEWHATSRKGHARVTGKTVGLAADATVAPEAMIPPGLPVPDDPAAISMFTAHRTDSVLHELGHATERMEAARTAAGDLRAYHCSNLARHLEDALNAAHHLVANLRDHYPAEAAELNAVAGTVGLAKAVSDDARAATTAHLLETTLHELTHADRHARQMLEDTPDDEWDFNADHAQKHLTGAVEHAGKLATHLKDNYPQVARWLNQLDQIMSPAEAEGGQSTEPEHAAYSKGGDETVSAQMANTETISGQVDLGPVIFDRSLFSGDLIRDLGGDPEAQGLS